MTEQDARHLLADVLEERQQTKLSEKIRANHFVEIPSSDVLAAIMRASKLRVTKKQRPDIQYQPD